MLYSNSNSIFSSGRGGTDTQKNGVKGTRFICSALTKPDDEDNNESTGQTLKKTCVE